jgi:hypothetical protein
MRRRAAISRPGYKPDSRWVAFDADHDLVITLEPQLVARESQPASTIKQKTKAVAAVKPPTGGSKPGVAAAAPTPAVPQPIATAPKTEPAATVPTPAKTETPDGKATYRGSKATISTDFPTD